MSRGGLLSGRMLDFNFLPSLTLHPSRYASFKPGDLSSLMARSATWQSTWHRHWSREILKELNVGLVSDLEQAELVVGLLPPATMNRLALHIAAVVHGPQLRHTIEGSRVRAMRDSLGEDLFAFTWRRAPEYAMIDLPLTAMPINLSKWELVGHGIILMAISDAEPAVARRIELKLPANSRDGLCPLPQKPALDLCLRVLKDLDSAWYFSFPVVH